MLQAHSLVMCQDLHDECAKNILLTNVTAVTTEMVESTERENVEIFEMMK